MLHAIRVLTVRLIIEIRKEGNVYLTTHSTHFYLRLYSVGHMVKDYLDSENGNPMPPELFYSHHPSDRIEHTTAFVTPVVEVWLEREIAQLVYHEVFIRRPIAPRANAFTTELHLASIIEITALVYIYIYIYVCIYSCVYPRSRHHFGAEREKQQNGRCHQLSHSK